VVGARAGVLMPGGRWEAASESEAEREHREREHREREQRERERTERARVSTKGGLWYRFGAGVGATPVLVLVVLDETLKGGLWNFWNFFWMLDVAPGFRSL